MKKKKLAVRKVKNISITFQQYFEIKKLFKIAGIETRPIYDKILYESKEKKLVALNGHIVRFHYIDLGKTKFLLDKEDFKLTEKVFKTIYTKPRLNKYKIPLPNATSKDVKLFSEYNKCIPDIQYILEKNKKAKEKTPFCFNLLLFKDFCDSYYKPNHLNFEIVHTDRAVPALVFSRERVLEGVICPLRDLYV